MKHLQKRSQNNLNLAYDQRLALLRSLSRALVENKTIKTTHSKAKTFRPFFEGRIMTRAIKSLLATEPGEKLHHIRMIRRYLAADMIKPVLAIAEKLKERPGGYLRIVKAGKRRGDNTETAYIFILDQQ